MTLSRRKFLLVSSAATLAPSFPAMACGTEWEAAFLGGPLTLRLEPASLPSPALFDALAAELERLDRLFSPRHPASLLSRLNRDRRLEDPPLDILDALRLADRLHRASDGAFDPVSWAPKAQAPASGWSGLRFGARRVVLNRPRASLSLDDLARGIAADRIAALLNGQDIAQARIDIGTDHLPAAVRPWSGELAGADRLLRKRSPHSGATKPPLLLSVSAGRFALADGLATTLAALPPGEWPAVLAEFPDARLLREA